MEMEKAVEFVRKCSKVSKRANYRKYQWTNKLLQLDEHLQRLFTDFNGQLEWKVKEVMDLVSNMEEMKNQITKGSGVVETQVVESEGRRSPLPQPHSLSVRLDYLQHMVGTSTTHVTEKTLIDTAENEIYNIELDPPSDVAKLHVKNVQAGARDVVKETLNSACRDLEMGDASGTEGTSSTSRNVEETGEFKEILKLLGGSAVGMLRNQTEIVDQHEPPPEPTVQFEVADDCETRSKGTVDKQKTAIVAEDQQKIKGKNKENVGVKNEGEVAAAAKLQLFSKKVRRQQVQTTVEIKVKMDCDGCERKVRSSVEGMKGVKQIDIDRKASKLTVVGYVEPKKVLARVAHRTGKKVEIWPYVPYNVVANPYVQGVDDKNAPAGNEPSDQQIRYTTAFSDER